MSHSSVTPTGIAIRSQSGHEDQIHQRDEQRATEELEGHIGARGEYPDGLPRLMTRIAAERVDCYPPQQAVALPLVACVLTQRTML